MRSRNGAAVNTACDLESWHLTMMGTRNNSQLESRSYQLRGMSIPPSPCVQTRVELWMDSAEMDRGIALGSAEARDPTSKPPFSFFPMELDPRWHYSLNPVPFSGTSPQMYPVFAGTAGTAGTVTSLSLLSSTSNMSNMSSTSGSRLNQCSVFRRRLRTE